MSKRFDELELYPGTAPLPPLPVVTAPQIDSDARIAAPLYRRALCQLTDLSLFAALAVALTPLVPEYVDFATLVDREWPALAAILGFLVLLSFFYFVGCWQIWGRTIGGTIFDVRIVNADLAPADFRNAAARWAAMALSIATGGLGFAMALLPGRLSLSDRISRTRAVTTG